MRSEALWIVCESVGAMIDLLSSRELLCLGEIEIFLY